MSDCKYPDIAVQLVGVNGNAFNLLGIVSTALKRNCISKEKVREFQVEATSGDYNHLICVCCEWVAVV